MIAKLCAWGETREDAVASALAQVDERDYDAELVDRGFAEERESASAWPSRAGACWWAEATAYLSVSRRHPTPQRVPMGSE